MMDIVNYNREAWANLSNNQCVYTIPVEHTVIENAKKGIINVRLTPTINVPHDWLGDLFNKNILCLASGGGQQGPILSAAGADVTVFDNCFEQLEKDKFVANRENLHIHCIQGDMRDLSQFQENYFDIIINPVSNCFVDNVEIIWQACFRILKQGGKLLSGFVNPLVYIFDFNKYDKENKIEVTYKIPYSDTEQLPGEELKEKIESRKPLEFGHTLDSQIGGQIKSGFVIKGFYEDRNKKDDMLDKYIKTYIATMAVKYGGMPNIA